ncbi:MAG: hypothetical protein ACREFP_23725 [Acetobacteraceae bacterium]
MPRSAKLGWTVRGVAVPLVLSLLLHGLLILALWFWPTRTRSPTLALESTRIILDTCVLESHSPTLLPEPELPADLLGTSTNATLAPRLDEPTPMKERPVPVPDPGSSIGNGNANGNGNIIHDGNLFPLLATATSVVYVLDRSVSMGMERKLDFARRELIASLRRLPPTVRFQVIDYNDNAKSLVIDGRNGLLPAEPAIIEKAISHLQTLEAGGNTNHLAALRNGLDLHPDVLYFLTDADDLRPEEVAAVTLRNQGSVIHTIELTRRRISRPEGPLVRLARDNRGTYRRVSLAGP